MQEPENHTEPIDRLETESRQLLSALKWSTRVRHILMVATVAFILGTGTCFYALFEEIKNQRLTETQQLLLERKDEFLEPLTQAAWEVAEKTGPQVARAFQDQLANDSSRYLQVLEQERDSIGESLAAYLEQRLREEHVRFLEENESLLVQEFPELKDPQRRANFERNLEAAFEKIGRRYYVKYFEMEYEKLVENIDRFPAIRPEKPDAPVAKQLAAETAKLFQMLAADASGDSLKDNAYVVAGLLSEHRKSGPLADATSSEPGAPASNLSLLASPNLPATNLNDSDDPK